MLSPTVLLRDNPQTSQYLWRNWANPSIAKGGKPALTALPLEALENPPPQQQAQRAPTGSTGRSRQPGAAALNRYQQVLQSAEEMAFVPDLDILESSSLNEEMFYGPDCLCLQKVITGVVETVRPLCGEAGLSPHIPFPPQKPQLDLEVASPGVGIQVTVTKGHPARTFRQAAVLVAALTKPAHKEFADSDLGDFLDDIFEPVPFQRINCSYAGAPVYRYTRSQSFDILDIDQKCFVLESPTQLVALHLQGPSAGRKVKLNIALYRPQSSQGGPGTGRVPVALGIKGYQLYMSCVMSGAEPVLQLEEADVRRDIESVELTRFIFYRLDSPTEGTTRFESAAFPGWFICTSLQPRQPVSITNQPDQVNIATYELSRH
ncbi:interleukin-1 beta-like isoform X2 [Melopsittacus undulatus]|uniref:interleukin-1 beta-like isoform X2 n=1 Tax=Melopsittacus undulatus TaxID=13146 RepID=UPI00146AE478|nr:interleukin-1 beta-like isoform X2 [Melopsittacus undulatus]